ncbi:MAG: metallophosphoesterase, partial [Chloroflexi bacterium]|nr:metallophosphoesterase [Chloroflexota bacterium]
MLITLSADLHLSNRLEHPERYMALLSILDAMQQEGQHSIILAGDTFDASYQNYADFDMICQKFPAISFYIIPGNHDPHINKRDIISQNVTIFTKPEVVSLEPGGTPFLFVPYEKNKTIGERIAEFSAQLVPDQWVLIAHGDYMEGIQTPNPYEGGTYMPITRKDLLTFRPAKVFLGHIHAALCKDPVYYCGSPCGLDISETGWRSYLVFESRSGLVQSKPINSKFLY